jgi:outer membrane murein-binding lipoprotein Lpp
VNRTKILIGLMCAGLVVLGCAKPAAPVVSKTDGGDKFKSLEARVAKLEEDLRSTTAERDAAVARAANFEQKWRAEASRAVVFEKERDAARHSLIARTTERDTLQVQFDGFRKNLKELIGQAETAARPATQPGSPANVLPNPPGL